MHELSIATSLVEVVREEAAKVSATMVTQVEVEIGTLSGVETEALQFAWELATKDSPAEGSLLVIHAIQARARCRECGTESIREDFISPCPSCGSFRFDIIQGKELRVTAIVVD
jgi:hydrogenase nickel incorporation protein HypA/HybF